MGNVFTNFGDLLVLLKEAFVILQILICPILILLILLQSGKGDDLGTALGGGGGSSSVLGTGGTSRILVKFTSVFATIFLLNSITLAWVFKHEASRSVGERIPESITPAADVQKELNVPTNTTPVAPTNPAPTTPVKP